MLQRGAALAAVNLTNQVQLSADLLVVGWSLGAAAAGDYYLASQVTTAALLFANASGQIALSRLPALVNEPERLAAALSVEVRRLLALAGPTALAIGLLAPLLVPALFGADHAGAATALLWLLPWFLLQHLTTLMHGALAATGRERAVLRGNFALLLVLVPGLALAATGATLAGFAAARSAAEVARLIVLGLRWKMAPAVDRCRIDRPTVSSYFKR
jgi:O-antigen/teichoic acid export membrane protein